MNEILDDNFISGKKPAKKLLSLPFMVITGSIFLMGILFHVQHFPGSGFMIVLGLGMLMGHIIARLFIFKFRPAILSLSIIATVACTYIMWSMGFFNRIGMYVFLSVLTVTSTIDAIVTALTKKKV